MKETKMSAEKTAKPKLMNIKLEKLHPFEDHPYKVLDDESMTELIESIKEYGLLNRIIVRPLEDKQDEYEIISGHRRVHAAELLGMKEVPAVVHFIDRDAATVMMVDSNCQRENLTLMEKARSYRMKADALFHQKGVDLLQGVFRLLPRFPSIGKQAAAFVSSQRRRAVPDQGFLKSCAHDALFAVKYI